MLYVTFYTLVVLFYPVAVSVLTRGIIFSPKHVCGFIIIIIIIKGIYIAQVRKGHKCAMACVQCDFDDDFIGMAASRLD